MNQVAFAIVAHPDDIEFRIAGTLRLLQQAGWEIHCMNIASGSLGSIEYSAAETRRVRRTEAQAAAKILGAHWHPSLVDDIEIGYDLKTLKRLTAVIREVKPGILFTHPPQDYMEDHTNACRLAVSAAFARGIPNLRTVPSRAAYDGDVTLYHCLPHGMCDQLCRPMIPQCYVNIASVMETKRAALNAHQSQVTWLQATQGMDAFTRFMEADALTAGRRSQKFKYAEGFWKHLHLGYCGETANPLQAALGKNYLVNPKWERLMRDA
ncbi:MAG: PIG-L family deacetylase [Verrucomicrobiota bacterium]